jgi:hypothetical protein
MTFNMTFCDKVCQWFSTFIPITGHSELGKENNWQNSLSVSSILLLAEADSVSSEDLSVNKYCKTKARFHMCQNIYEIWQWGLIVWVSGLNPRQWI